MGSDAFIYEHFPGITHDMNMLYEFENHVCKIIATSPRGQWVNYTRQCELMLMARNPFADIPRL